LIFTHTYFPLTHCIFQLDKSRVRTKPDQNGFAGGMKGMLYLLRLWTGREQTN